MSGYFAETKNIILNHYEKNNWLSCMGTIILYDCWNIHSRWITQHQPKFGSIIANNMQLASKVSAKDYHLALIDRIKIKDNLERLLHKGDLLVIPTLHDFPPLLSATNKTLNQYGQSASLHTCLSSLGGLPEVTLPLVKFNGLHLGLSLIGPENSDERLLDLAVLLTNIISLSIN